MIFSFVRSDFFFFMASSGQLKIEFLKSYSNFGITFVYFSFIDSIRILYFCQGRDKNVKGGNT